MGLSPRLRGNLTISERAGTIARSIPAPAGEPRQNECSHLTLPVYPRACGGTQSYIPGSIPAPAGEPRANRDWGLSPRLRGNLDANRVGAFEARSIPAPAGEPPYWVYHPWDCTVYPRACGGTMAGEGTADIAGLSPRLRGKPVYPRACGGTHPSRSIKRSIPAPAGEPRSVSRFGLGLSPRLRGNPIEPTDAVYPRACGGESRGLSPRLPKPTSRSRSLLRLPSRACGGTVLEEPQGGPPVYPRACGGTRLNAPNLGGWTRSIPAPAGEPA